MKLLVYGPVVEGMGGVGDGVEDTAGGEVGGIAVKSDAWDGGVYGDGLLVLEERW